MLKMLLFFIKDYKTITMSLISLIIAESSRLACSKALRPRQQEHPSLQPRVVLHPHPTETQLRSWGGKTTSKIKQDLIMVWPVLGKQVNSGSDGRIGKEAQNTTTVTWE